MLNTIIIFIGDYLIFLVIFPLIYFWFRDRKLFWRLILAVGLAMAIENLIKHFFPTSRPYEVTAIPPILRQVSKSSFPSGHSTFVMAFAATTFLKYKKLGLVFLFLAVLVGIARILGGVHFGIDILGGFLLGFLSAFFVSKINL